MNNTCSADKPYLGWFAKICSIPHESKHERQLSDYLVTFAVSPSGRTKQATFSSANPARPVWNRLPPWFFRDTWTWCA